MTQERRLEIANLIQTQLRHEHSTGKRARIDPTEIVERYHDESTVWYYVPVTIAPYEHELGTFYELFSNVEEKLEEQGINILIVPTRHATPAGDHAA
jgi:hypothetical protein